MAEAKAVFSSRYAGSVGYYAAMLRFGQVAIDCGERYDKRHKHLQRMDIEAADGRQSLSVPLVKPNRNMAVGDIVISDHGNWRHNHWGALFSAYGRTPFFDYFADDLKAIYDNREIKTVAALNLALHFAVVDFLDLPIETSVFSEKGGWDAAETVDRRDGAIVERPVGEYYQIWSVKTGFQSGLSILDMLFNVGREAILLLSPGR